MQERARSMMIPISPATSWGTQRNISFEKAGKKNVFFAMPLYQIPKKKATVLFMK